MQSNNPDNHVKKTKQPGMEETLPPVHVGYHFTSKNRQMQQGGGEEDKPDTPPVEAPPIEVPFENDTPKPTPEKSDEL